VKKDLSFCRLGDPHCIPVHWAESVGEQKRFVRCAHILAADDPHIWLIILWEATEEVRTEREKYL
jgi:hypothetical protein